MRKLISPDLVNLQSDMPDDPDYFCILIQAIVGPSDGPGEESFDFLVCTASWIATGVEKDGFLFGRHYLVIKAYSFELIYNTIDSLCHRIWGDNWNDVATKLSRYGKWEFEDYVSN